MTTNQDIYAELEALLQPASLPGPWRHLPAPPDYRNPAPLQSLRSLASSLREKYTEEELVSAGVFVRRPRLSINPHLVLGNLLLLRRAPDEPPYEIVSVAGCISGSQPPVLAALEDAATQRRLEVFEGDMFATFTLADAAVLQSFGYPAVPAAGLADLRGSVLERFCKALDVRSLSWASSDDDEDDGDHDDDGVEQDDVNLDDPPGVAPPSPSVPQASTVAPQQSPIPPPAPGQDQPASAQQPSAKAGPSRRPATQPAQRIRLCFVGSNLAKLSLAVPEKLAYVLAHLEELAGMLDVYMHQISVWQPTPELQQKLSFALTKGTLNHVRRTISLSFDNSTHLLPLRAKAPTKQPATFREVLQSLGNDGGDRLDDRAAHLQDYRQLIDLHVVGPLREQAEAQSDPAQKARALVQAQYLRQQLEVLPQLGLGIKPGNGRLRPEEADNFKSFQKSMSEFLEFTDPSRKKAR